MDKVAGFVGRPLSPFILITFAIGFKNPFIDVRRYKLESSLLEVMYENVFGANEPITGFFYFHAKIVVFEHAHIIAFVEPADAFQQRTFDHAAK